MSLNEIIMSLEIGLIYGIIAIGIYITFRLIDFPDLTCDGSFVVGAASSSMLIKLGYNPWLTLLIAMLAGACAGSACGVLNTRCKVTALLAGILVAFMLYSINLRIMHGVPNITLLGVNTIFTNALVLPRLTLIALLVVIILGYLFLTDYGLALRSIGENKRLALNGGVNVNKLTIIGLAISNSLIALGGALSSQHQGFADVGSGVGTVIIGLASVMLGEKLLPYRSIIVQLCSCLLGSVLYRLLISLALHSEVFGLATQDLNLLTGLMIVIIMITPKRHIC